MYVLMLNGSVRGSSRRLIQNGNGMHAPSVGTHTLTLSQLALHMCAQRALHTGKKVFCDSLPLVQAQRPSTDET